MFVGVNRVLMCFMPCSVIAQYDMYLYTYVVMVLVQRTLSLAFEHVHTLHLVSHIFGMSTNFIESTYVYISDHITNYQYKNDVMMHYKHPREREDRFLYIIYMSCVCKISDGVLAGVFNAIFLISII